MKEINLKKIYKNRKLIIEGIKNSVFKTEAVEAIAKERNRICQKCIHFDSKGDDCMVKGTQPCCGHCGCSLHLKQRSLSSGCDLGLWNPVLTDEEELDHDILNTENDD